MLRYLPDGQTLAFSSTDHRIRLWHLNPSGDRPSPRGHAPFEGWAVAFSPDGRTLATAGDDHLIRFWDPDTGAELAPPRDQGSLVTSLAWSPDNSILASGSMDQDRRVCIWRMATGTRTDLKGHTGKVAQWRSALMARCWHPAAMIVPSGSGSRRWGVRFASFPGTPTGSAQSRSVLAEGAWPRAVGTAGSSRGTFGRAGAGSSRPVRGSHHWFSRRMEIRSPRRTTTVPRRSSTPPPEWSEQPCWAIMDLSTTSPSLPMACPWRPPARTSPSGSGIRRAARRCSA